VNAAGFDIRVYQNS